MLEARYCTLCGPSAAKKIKFAATFDEKDLNAKIFSARRSPDRRHFQFVECGDCGIIFSDPACDPSRLASLYEASAVTYEAQEEQIYASYAPILDRALARTSNRGAFLEIGGGRGFMLHYGVKNGFESQIEVEPSVDAEQKYQPASVQSRFIRGIFVPGVLPVRSVSLVCFFQMLDHVPSPKAFLDAVFEVLEPGGVAVCVTHDTSALSAKLLGERSPIYDIEHTYLFNRKNMSRIFGAVGFEEPETFSIANRYALRHWLHLAPLPRPFKAVALKSLASAGFADFRVNLRAGNFAVIGSKPK